MQRKIFSVTTDLVIAAICRDDRKHVPLNWFDLARWNNRFITCDGMPDDARVVDVRFNGFGSTVDFLIESESFEDVEDGKAIPYLEVRMTTYTNYVTYLEMTKADKPHLNKKPLGTLPDDTGGSVPFGNGIEVDGLGPTGVGVSPLVDNYVRDTVKKEIDVDFGDGEKAEVKPRGREFI
jgi:hypothetical protein